MAVAWEDQGTTDLRVARRIGDEWTAEVAAYEGEVGQRATAELDDFGRQLVAYVDTSDDVWRLKIIDEEASSESEIAAGRGGSPDWELALDADGLPAVLVGGDEVVIHRPPSD